MAGRSCVGGVSAEHTRGTCGVWRSPGPSPRVGQRGPCGSGGAPWPRPTRQLLLHQRTAGWGGPPGRRTRRWNSCAGVRSRASDVLFAGHIWAGNRWKVGVLLGVTPAPEAQRSPAKSRLAGGAVVFGAGTGAAGVTRPSPPALTKHGPSRHPLPTPPAVGGGTFSPGRASPPPRLSSLGRRDVLRARPVTSKGPGVAGRCRERRLFARRAGRADPDRGSRVILGVHPAPRAPGSRIATEPAPLRPVVVAGC